MDRNTIIGLTLIFVLFIVWQQFMAPSREKIEAQRRAQDSLAREEQRLDSLSKLNLELDSASLSVDTAQTIADSLRQQTNVASFGPFAPASTGSEEMQTLENDLMKITFSNRGARIVSVELKKHFRISEDEKKNEVKSPLYLLDNKNNRFEYLLPITGVPGGSVNTRDLYFTVSSQSDNSITFRASAGEGRFFEQHYSLSPGTYRVDYGLRLEGLQSVIPADTEAIQLNWVNYLDKLEKNVSYERNYSTIDYKVVAEAPTYLSRTRSETEAIDQPLKWVAHSNQFFNTTLIANDSFLRAELASEVPSDLKTSYLKKFTTQIAIPYRHGPSEQIAMHFYIGANEFNRLYAMGDDLQDIIPFGWSIFGTINRWVIRPLFNFLSTFIGSKGIVILVLTFIVKLLLYPLNYRMLYSQSKMGALKPQLESLKEKHKDDPQQQQMEQMKIYREFGVNPLGGCLPMVLQMPIWFALYRFFPAAIEFRQAGFLWATDLSSYDAWIKLPFDIPMGFGSHISLFTMLWAISTLVYTYYNTRHMDMSANPAMKYMQYIMPLFFLGFFNSFASGLTAYLLFSNLITIAQTLITKNFVIDQEKLKEELEAYRRKPKKKGGFQERLEAALKEQQRQQQLREQQSKKKGR